MRIGKNIYMNFGRVSRGLGSLGWGFVVGFSCGSLGIIGVVFVVYGCFVVLVF